MNSYQHSRRLGPLIRLTIAATLLLMLFARPAGASVIDLTGGEGSSGTINGALFEFDTQQPSGTGVIDPFVRLHSHGSAAAYEHGYNSSGRPLPFDAQSSPVFTHDLTMSDLFVVERNGISYFEFLLDINESNGHGDQYLSLDKLRIYTSPDGGKTTTNLSSLGTLRYNLDAGSDSYILLDASLSHGSGSSDMLALIPTANFSGAAADDFVYFYSKFGWQGVVGSGANTKDYGPSGGFEEWAVRSGGGISVIPEPASLAIMMFGGVLLLRRPQRVRVA